MKIRTTLEICLLCAGLLSGCAAAPTPGLEAPEESSAAEPLVVNIGCIPEFTHYAYTIEELTNDSDVIVEGIVSESEGFVLEKSNGIVCTRMQIEPLAVYKGAYEGETLLSYGGTMNLGKYYAALGETGMSYTSEDLRAGVVNYEWENNFAPKAGDRILFFGCFDSADSSVLWNTNSVQGLYLCDDETVYTTALHINEHGWSERLVEDIIARCSGTVTEPFSTENASPTLTFDRDAFLEIID